MANERQQAGEVCEGCRSRWEKKQQPPVKLVNLLVPSKRYNEDIVVCPYCDGPIVAAAKRRADRGN